MPNELGLYFLRTTLPSSEGSTIDFVRLYCTYGLWKHMQLDLHLAGRRDDIDYLSILLAHTAHGIGYWPAYAPQQEAGTAFFVRLIELGADPCRRIVSDDGQTIYVLPRIVRCLYFNPLAGILQALRQFDLSNVGANMPQFGTCNKY